MKAIKYKISDSVVIKNKDNNYYYLGEIVGARFIKEGHIEKNWYYYIKVYPFDKIMMIEEIDIIN